MSKYDYVVAAMWLTALAAVAGGVYWISPVAFYIVLADGLYVLAIFLAAFAVGYLPVRFLARTSRRSERLILSWALGTGLLAVVVLLTGLAGMMTGWVWRIVIFALAAGGFALLYYHVRTRPEEDETVFESGRWGSMLGWILVPFAILALVCATIPPGVIWSAEGGGYDVLEYHLQVPKEWYDASRITFLPHNVYANFPFNAEMFYLLAMILRDDPHEAIYLCQLLHVGFAVGFVLAVWVFVRPWGIVPAAVAAVAAGTSGWVMYLAPLAYVEAPMLFVATAAVGMLVRALWTSRLNVTGSILIGLLLGLAGGFKYTAPAMLGGGVFLVMLLAVIPTGRWKAIVFGPLAMVLAAAAALSPWLIRNTAWTGNPVFPLAYKTFGGANWDAALADRWRVGHTPREDQKPIIARLKTLYWAGCRNIIVDSLLAEKYRSAGQFKRAEDIRNPRPIDDLPKFGLAILVLPWLVFFTRRQKFIDYLLLLIFLGQVCVWLFATHLQGRFLIPVLAVLPFLIGRSAAVAVGRSSRAKPVILAVVLAVAAGLNFNDGLRRYRNHVYHGGKRIEVFGAHEAFLAGKVGGYEYLEKVNEKSNARTLLIGEARPFYIKGSTLYWTVFNRNAFARHARRGREIRDYIARVRPDFIYVNWREIERLGGTYGFDESVTPKLFRFLSSPPRYVVKRVGRWGGLIELRGSKTPARILYRVEYPAPKPKRPPFKKRRR